MTNDEIKAAQAHLRSLCDQFTTLYAHGCSDGYCRITGPKGGMHTNGGCRCYQSLEDIGLEIAATACLLKHYRGLSPLH